MLDCIEISIEFRDHCCSARVNAQVKLLQLCLRVIRGAQSPSKWLASHLSHVNAGKGIPFFIESVMRIPATFEPLNIDNPDRPIHRSGGEQQNATYNCNPSCLSPQRPGKGGSRQCGYACIQNHRGGGVNVVQNRNREDATRSRTGKIGGVQCSRVQRKSSKRETDNHPSKHERNRNKSERQSSPGEFAFRIGGKIQMHSEANGTRQSEKEPGICEGEVAGTPLHDFDKNSTGSQAAHCKRKRH